MAVGRNDDHFDRQFFKQDEESFVHFLNEANKFEDRMNLVELWMRRKENEINQRVNLPTPEFQKPDHLINAEYLEQQKQARESLLAKMLSRTEFMGDKNEKSYAELDSNDLHLIAEGMAVRLNLFNRSYPKFMP